MMRWLSSKLCLPALITLAVVGALLSGCVPQPVATALPPATIYGPVQPQAEAAPKPMTAAQPAPASQAAPATVAAPTQAPPSGGTPTDVPPSPPPQEAASPVANNPGAPRKAAQVTILHTNDVFGEIDPCG